MKARTDLVRTRWGALAALLAACLLALPVGARPFRPAMMPNGNVFSCANCHVNPAGGGRRTPFGEDVFAIVQGPSATPFWSAALAQMDSDGDGFTNGEELGDPDGDGTPVPGALVTNPGDPQSLPPTNEPPVVSIATPVDGAAVAVPAVVEVVAEATDADGAVELVEFFEGDVLLAALSAGPYRIVADLAEGEHALTARATDNEGASTVSAPVRLTVTPPDPILLTASIANEETLSLAWGGGGGPFAIQEQETVGGPWRTLLPLTAEREASVPLGAGTGFLRIADFASHPPLTFTASLQGGNVRPDPASTPGNGSGTLRLEGNTLTLDLAYSGLTAPATAAHIHGPASAEETAGVLVNLEPLNGGGFAEAGGLSGSVVLEPEIKASLLSGRTYINIHTATHPSGEIRGQIAPIAMVAALNGTKTRPDPVESTGTGSGGLILAGDRLHLNLVYAGLSESATAAHIHGPASAEESAGVLVDLAPFNGGSFGSSGGFRGISLLDSGTLAATIDGRTYVNIHTPQQPSGEIRGQITPDILSVPFTAALGGDNEKPIPVATPGAGSAILRLRGNTLLFEIAYSGLSAPATAAHIHGPATSAGTAGVLVDLEPHNGGGFGSAGTFSGAVELDETLRAAVLAGQTYINIHTPNHSNGEIRGQISPAAMRASLNGANVRPDPVDTRGAGTGHFILTGNRLRFNLTYRGLSSIAIAAHIHGPAGAEDSAGVLVDLEPFKGGAFDRSGTFAGELELTAAQVAAVIDGLAYVNIHTPNNPAGEIRGQILP